MSFIIKSVIRKVFQKYLNLQKQLNIQSGSIKLPFGTINHDKINQMLEPIGLKINSSIYKNLSILIPLTQIVSKPIKISIERFEVEVVKMKTAKSQNGQSSEIMIDKKNSQQKRDEPQFQIDIKQKATKQQSNPGYIKNMVNRLLYNMQVSIQKVVIKMKDQQSNGQSSHKSIFNLQFQIINLQLRNSLVLLEANIIKKIFNLQQLIVRHKFAQIIIKDLNISFDYNNKKLSIIAILDRLYFNLKQIPVSEIQKLISKDKNARKSYKTDNLSIKNKQQVTLQQQTLKQAKQRQIQIKDKSMTNKKFDVNLYMKINNSELCALNLINIKTTSIQLKMKQWHQKIMSSDQQNQKDKSYQLHYQKHRSAQFFFKTIQFSHLNQEFDSQKDFMIIRYLPWSNQVKIFTQYQDNILKSSFIKINQKSYFNKKFIQSKSQIGSTTSFDDKNQLNNQNKKLKNKDVKIQLCYIELFVDFQVIKQLFLQSLKQPNICGLIKLLSQQNQVENIKNVKSAQNQKPIQSKSVQLNIQFVVYRLMINILLHRQIDLKIYGSFRGNYISTPMNLAHNMMAKKRTQQYEKRSKQSMSSRSKQSISSRSEYSYTKIENHQIPLTKRNYSQNVQASQFAYEKPQKHSYSMLIKPQEIKVSKLQNTTPKNSIISRKKAKISEQNAGSMKLNFQFMQLCVQCNNYSVLDLGNSKINILKTQNIPFEIIIVGTSINSQLSIQLIKQIINVVPDLQRAVNQVKHQINKFSNQSNSSYQFNQQNSIRIQKLKKQKKQKISIYLKINEINIKFGSFIRQKTNISSTNKIFIWLFKVQLVNISLGIKNISNIKAKLQIMLFVTSPQTLHKITLTRNGIMAQIAYNKKCQQLVVDIKNQISLVFDQNSIQILIKYFSQLIDLQTKQQQVQKLNRNNNKRQNYNSSLKDDNQKHCNKQKYKNACCFIQLLNGTDKTIKFIQSNIRKNLYDSMDLAQLNELQNTQQSISQNQKSIELENYQSQTIFLLNQNYFIIQINGIRTNPISIQFQPVKISTKTFQQKYNRKFVYQYEQTLVFVNQNIEMPDYVIHFLLNEMLKIQKIIIKNIVCLISSQNPLCIVHETYRYVSFSDQVITSQNNKITQQYIIDRMRFSQFGLNKWIMNFQPNSFEQQPYLLIMNQNQQIDKISVYKKQNSKQKVYKISSLLTKSNLNKSQTTSYSLFGLYQFNSSKVQVEGMLCNVETKLFNSYIYQIKHLETSYFVVMPFLVIQNSLGCDIELQIMDKKTQSKRIIYIKSQQTKQIYPSTHQQANQNNIFDFYNKQFTMKMRLVSWTKSNFNNLANHLNSQTNNINNGSTHNINNNINGSTNSQTHNVHSSTHNINGSTHNIYSQTNDSQNKQIKQKQIIYESQQHYFNTFFMVQHQFQTLITLRSNKKSQFDKKYIFLRQQLMLKTKLLKFQSSCRIINETDFNFGFKFQRNGQKIISSSSLKSPKKLYKQVDQQQLKTQKKFVLSSNQQSNNHILIPKRSQIQYITQIRQSNILQILFQNLQETKIQAQQDILKQGGISILSFNFVQISKKYQNQKQYCQLLFRLKIKTIQNHQFLVIQNFITFKNLSLQTISLNLQRQQQINPEKQVCFPLPPSINKKFNNRLISLSNVAQIQSLYEELFNFSNLQNFKQKDKLISKQLQQKINVYGTQHFSQKPFIQILLNKQHQKQLMNLKLYFHQLLYNKNNMKQCNLGQQRGIKLFSLLKDIKGGIIRLFFVQKLFNPNQTYLLVQNNSNKNLLLSQDNTQYTHHFVKKSVAKTKIIKNDKRQNIQQQQDAPQKIFLSKKSFNTLLNKGNFELFLCDQKGKHLQKTSKQNLIKQNLQLQYYKISNFQVFDLAKNETFIKNKNQAQTVKPKISIKSHKISINVDLYEKLNLNVSVSNLSFRLISVDKIDCLIEQVAIKNAITNQHILRIPEQSYILFQGKSIGGQNTTKFIFVKNLFIKCKNAIINLQKNFLYEIICLTKNLFAYQTQEQTDFVTKKAEFQYSVRKTVYEPLHKNQGYEKLKQYLFQQLFLVKNIYCHEIHLSISINLQDNNFSNVIIVPHYEMTNIFMRENSLIKQIGDFYKTNILAKLPKLSIFFQSIKNPLNLFRTVMKVGSALKQKINYKKVITFQHQDIPNDPLNFSMQRWNIVHLRDDNYKSQQTGQIKSRQYVLTYLYKNDCCYLISNMNFIIIYLKDNDKDSEQQHYEFFSSQKSLVHYEKQQNSLQAMNSRKNKNVWFKFKHFAKVQVIPLKDIQKLKLIRNKKYSQLMIQFKRNFMVNICEEYNKCLNIIDTINSLLM